MKNIEAALKKGAKLHAFRSGGGLRVVSIDTVKGGYGEHSHFKTAMKHADRNLFEQLDYKHQYNSETGKYKQYYTGSAEAEDAIDEWILKGNTIDITFVNDTKCFVVELVGYKHQSVPRDIHEEVLQNDIPKVWSDRGFTFMSTKTSGIEKGVTTEILEAPTDRKADAWIYKIKKTGIANSLKQAIKIALTATEIEIEDTDWAHLKA